MKKCPFGDKKSSLSVQQRQGFVLGSLHNGAFAGSFVVDAAQVQHAVYDNTVQLLVVLSALLLGVGAHGVERYHDVAVQPVALCVVEGDNVGVEVVLQVLPVHLQYLLVVGEEIAYLAYPLAVGGGHSLNPFRGGAPFDVGHLYVLSVVGNHVLGGVGVSLVLGQVGSGVLAEVGQFAHHARADVGQLRLGEEQHRLHPAYLAVDVGLLALVFKIFHAPHPFHDEAGLYAVGEVDGQSAVAAHLHGRLVGEKPADGRYPLFGGVQVGLALVHPHAYHQFVEERERSPHDGEMADGEWVETAHEDACFHDSAVWVDGMGQSKRLGWMMLLG